MRVVLTEASFEEGVPVAAALTEAGIEIVDCHVSGGLCRAVAPGHRCPLDQRDAVDAVVVVRSGGRHALAAREYGAVCGVRAGVPVVVTSAHAMPPPAAPDGLAGRVEVVEASRLVAWLRTHAADSGPNS